MNIIIRNVLLGGLLWLAVPLAAQVPQDLIDKAKAAGMTDDQIQQEIAKRMGQSGAGQTTSRASDAVISDRVIATTPGEDRTFREEQGKGNFREKVLKNTAKEVNRKPFEKNCFRTRDIF